MDTHCPTALLLDATGEPLVAGITWDHPGLAEPTAQLIAALEPAHRRLLGNHLMPATAMGAAHRLSADHRAPSRRSSNHFRARRYLAGPVVDRRARHRSHPGLVHRLDGQHRRILPLAGRCRAAARDSAAATAAGATVAECPRPTTGDRGRDSRPAPGHSGARRIRRHTRCLLRAGNRAGRSATAHHGHHARGVQRTGRHQTRAPRRCNGSTSEPAVG